MECIIESDLPDNVSDHFPLRSTIVINVPHDTQANIVSASVRVYPKIDWSDRHMASRYHDRIREEAPSLCNIDTYMRSAMQRKPYQLWIDNLFI